MRYLVIDTAVRVGEVQLLDEQGRVLAARTLPAGDHEKTLAASAAQFLSLADSGAVTVLLSHGPGSYTGLRISSAFVAGLCVGGVVARVVTFDSRLLHGMTQLLNQPERTAIVVGLETRRDEFVGLRVERLGAQEIRSQEVTIERRDDPQVWWMQLTDRPISSQVVWFVFAAGLGPTHAPDQLPQPFYGGTVSAKTRDERRGLG